MAQGWSTQCSRGLHVRAEWIGLHVGVVWRAALNREDSAGKARGFLLQRNQQDG